MSAGGDGPLLEVRGLSVSYRRGQAALADFELVVGAGERWALVGESGAGKSTALAALMGLLPPGATLTAAAWRFAGTALPPASAGGWQALRGRGLALLFQEPWTALDPLWRVGDLLQETLRAYGMSRRTAPAQARYWLQAAGLPDPERVMRAYPHQLSGGMAQRVALALALCGRPRLLLADEPTGSLDGLAQARVLETLRLAGQQWGMALVVVSHDMAMVAQVADWVAVLRAGRILESGPLPAVWTQPQHPYTRMLLETAPRLDRPRRRIGLGDPGTRLATDDPSGCPLAERCRAARRTHGQAWVAISPADGWGRGHAVRCWHGPELWTRVEGVGG